MYCRTYRQKLFSIFSYYPLNAYRAYSSVSSSIPGNTGNLCLVFLFSLISLILLISEEQILVSLIFLSFWFSIVLIFVGIFIVFCLLHTLDSIYQ